MAPRTTLPTRPARADTPRRAAKAAGAVKKVAKAVAKGAAGATRRRKKPAAPPQLPFTVFLDRDGVLNRHPLVQVRRWKRFEWLPGSRAALARLNRPDVQIALITNQPGTGVGLSTRAMIHRLHGHVLADAAKAGGRIDHVEVCFAPAFWPSRRRKPHPGMLEDAVAVFEQGRGFDPTRAIFVGDKLKDAQAAAAFGIPCILLATTMPARRLQARAERRDVPYLAIADGLPEAVELILSFVSQT